MDMAAIVVRNSAAEATWVAYSLTVNILKASTITTASLDHFVMELPRDSSEDSASCCRIDDRFLFSLGRCAYGSWRLAVFAGASTHPRMTQLTFSKSLHTHR